MYLIIEYITIELDEEVTRRKELDLKWQKLQEEGVAPSYSYNEQSHLYDVHVDEFQDFMDSLLGNRQACLSYCFYKYIVHTILNTSRNI